MQIPKIFFLALLQYISLNSLNKVYVNHTKKVTIMLNLENIRNLIIVCINIKRQRFFRFH